LLRGGAEATTTTETDATAEKVPKETTIDDAAKVEVIEKPTNEDEDVECVVDRPGRLRFVF